MALSKTYTFTAYTTALAAEINAVLDQLFAAIGSQAYTGSGAWFADDESTTASLQKVSDRLKSWVRTNDSALNFMRVRGTSVVQPSVAGHPQLAANAAAEFFSDFGFRDLLLVNHNTSAFQASVSGKSRVETDGSSIYVDGTKVGAVTGGDEIFPGTKMYYQPDGANAAPLGMYFTGTGATITMGSTTQYTDDGYRATILTASSGTTYFGWNTAQNGCAGYVDVESLRGQKFTMGAHVYSTTASRVKLLVTDGTTTTRSTAYHAGGGWEWMTATLGATVAAGATDINAYVEVTAGAQITIYVEVPGGVVGETMDYPVPYRGGGRTHRARVASSNGDSATCRAITGCGFSPVAVDCINMGAAAADSNDAGGAQLAGATTTQNYNGYGGSAATHTVYRAATIFCDHSAWGSDGWTAAYTNSSGSTYNFLYVLHEGYPA